MCFLEEMLSGERHRVKIGQRKLLSKDGHKLENSFTWSPGELWNEITTKLISHFRWKVPAICTLKLDYSCPLGKGLNFLSDVTPICLRLIFWKRGQLWAVSIQYSKRWEMGALACIYFYSFLGLLVSTCFFC